MSHSPAIGSLQVALTAPTLICPDHGAIYRLDGRHYRLMNGTASAVVAHLVNFGATPATVAGSIAGTSGVLLIPERTAFMLGWSVRDTAWRALRMCGAVVANTPEELPPGARPHDGPVPADADFLVETLDGITARLTLSRIAAFLAGSVPALPGLQPSPAWSPA